jgi:hypothetical protein
MPIQLNPGYQAQVKILHMQDAQHGVLYTRDFNSPDQLREFIVTHGKSKEGWPMLHGLIFPLRINNDWEFAKDLLLPTFFRFASKIDSFAKRVFASFFAIVLDLLTLPIRLVATPFRYHHIKNHPEQEHPLVPLIRERYGLQQLNDNVSLYFKEEKVEIRNDLHFPTAKEIKTAGYIDIALKRLPGGIKSRSHETSEERTYWFVHGEWDCQGSITGNSNRYTFAC